MESQHGRLSQGYVQEILSLATPEPPATSAGGRLAADYSAAVAEMLSNPSTISRVVLDERFESAWTGGEAGALRAVGVGFLLAPSNGGVAAVSAPLAEPLRDAVVGATFRKLGGLPGGAYGVLVRRNQAGRYYLAQVRDSGEVAIWRREQEHWAELVPWTRSL